MTALFSGLHLRDLISLGTGYNLTDPYRILNTVTNPLLIC